MYENRMQFSLLESQNDIVEQSGETNKSAQSPNYRASTHYITTRMGSFSSRICIRKQRRNLHKRIMRKIELH